MILTLSQKDVQNLIERWIDEKFEYGDRELSIQYIIEDEELSVEVDLHEYEIP